MHITKDIVQELREMVERQGEFIRSQRKEIMQLMKQASFHRLERDDARQQVSELRQANNELIAKAKESELS